MDFMTNWSIPVKKVIKNLGIRTETPDQMFHIPTHWKTPMAKVKNVLKVYIHL